MDAFWARWETTDKTERFGAVEDRESEFVRMFSAVWPTEMFNAVLKRTEQDILTQVFKTTSS